MSRQVFFSFEYMKDVWRAAQVRNMGKVDGKLIIHLMSGTLEV